MKTRNAFAGLVAALAIAFSGTAMADDKALVTIAFDIPAEIVPSVKQKMRFVHVRVVGLHENPDYVFYGKIVGNRDHALTMQAWLVPGMDETTYVTARCNSPECTADILSASTLWRVFVDAFNKVLIANKKGFGQYLPKRCISSTPAWADLEVESAIRTGLEVGWRYKLAERGRQPDQSSHFYFKLLPPESRSGMVGRFIPDSVTQSMKQAAGGWVHSNCAPARRKAFDGMVFVTQFETRDLYVQTTVQNERTHR